jgi:hypothetical protein
VLEAYQWARSQQERADWQGVTIVSDCMAVIQAIQNLRLEGFPSWQALETLQQIEQMRRELGWQVRIEHNIRDAMKVPHVLANWIRRRTGIYAAPYPPNRQELGEELRWSLGGGFTREPD